MSVQRLLLKMYSNNVRWAFNCSKWKPSQSDMLTASACVQPEEKERLSKFVFKEDLTHSLIGRLMMRKFIQTATEKKYNEIKIIRDERGKPLYGDNLNFNVSHHGEYAVLVGVKGDVLIGVDIMRLKYEGGKSLEEFFRIMNRQFSKDEWDSIKGAGGEREQAAMFFRHWCLKESYVKALGVGITINLQEISFKINTKNLSVGKIVNDTELFFKGKKLDWYFNEIMLDDEHCVAVAFDKIPAKNDVHFEEITFDYLTRNAIPLTPYDEQFVTNYFSKLNKA